MHQCPDDDEDRKGRYDLSRCHGLTELDQLRLVAEAGSRKADGLTDTLLSDVDHEAAAADPE